MEKEIKAGLSFNWTFETRAKHLRVFFGSFLPENVHFSWQPGRKFTCLSVLCLREQKKNMWTQILAPRGDQVQGNGLVNKTNLIIQQKKCHESSEKLQRTRTNKPPQTVSCLLQIHPVCLYLSLSALSLHVCCCLFVLWVSFLFFFYPVSASPFSLQIQFSIFCILIVWIYFNLSCLYILFLCRLILFVQYLFLLCKTLTWEELCNRVDLLLRSWHVGNVEISTSDLGKNSSQIFLLGNSGNLMQTNRVLRCHCISA